jgi:uncharacterized protein YbbC (DUF1343 family)
MTGLRFFPPRLLAPLALLGLLAGCASRPPPAPVPPAPPVVVTPGPAIPPPRPAEPPPFPVMLGIDVLEAGGFRSVLGKRIGLLTHPAGVNRRGESSADVLFRAPGVQLVALFAPEHGIRGDVKAAEQFKDTTDPRTRLPVYAFYGDNLAASKERLRGLDALVIDLQDIGVRSYTFNVSMRYALEACFERGVEVIVLDRPNPLGGLKVDGPILDRELFSGVGAFRIPYVHGLTMAELALFAAQEPGALAISDAVRDRGRLTIVPMRGWRRDMTWPQTGLKFVPTSQLVQDFDAVIGYAMVGLGCEPSALTHGFKHGVGKSFPFRGLSFSAEKSQKPVTALQLAADLAALRLPGVAFRVRPDPADPKRTGVYVDVTDWAAWNPTELSFQMMRLACRYDPPNPFAKLDAKDARSFNIHVGSAAWWTALKRDGARVDVEKFLADWRAQAAAYQERTQKYRLY